MVFCCIAIVGFAILYFSFLTLRQLFSRPRRDKNYPGRVPPRAISGNGALPVYGHTRQFTKWGGNVALLFSPTMSEWAGCGWCCCCRQLGHMFSIFIWGQWRIVIQGEERIRKVLKQPSLKEGWPWTPPISLLGKSCLDLLEPEEADMLANFLETPLRQRHVVAYADDFARLAEISLQAIVSRKGHHHANNFNASLSSLTDPEEFDRMMDDNTHKIKWAALRSYTLDLMDGPILNMNLWTTTPPLMDFEKPDDLIPSEVPNGNTRLPFSSSRSSSDDDMERAMSDECLVSPHHNRAAPTTDSKEEDVDKPDRHLALLWMERIKAGLCVIKLTFGTNWMQIWRMNEYGRALNARKYLENLISAHVAERVKDTPVAHAPGHFYNDWLTTTFPLLTLTESLFHKNDSILGDGSRPCQYRVERSKSDSMILSCCQTRGAAEVEESDPIEACMSLQTQQDLAAPQFESPPRSSQKLKAKLGHKTVSTPGKENMTPSCIRKSGMVNPKLPDLLLNSSSPAKGDITMVTPITPVSPTSPAAATSKMDGIDIHYHHSLIVNGYDGMSPKLEKPIGSPLSPRKGNTARFNTDFMEPMNKPNSKIKGKPLPLLDIIIRQEDMEGKGITQAAITEVCILLWMIMDAGNAWTAMALNLISNNDEARSMVQDELDMLVQLHGQDQLFVPSVLAKMKHLDALLYEAIRLCPPFLGGMKVTQETVFFEDLDLQVPKNSNVFFCQPTPEDFDLSNAVGKKPELLGSHYPNVELYGFLPLRGLEVPLMVLQSKVFLAVLLQKFTPYVSKRSTFIRRVTKVLTTCTTRAGGGGDDQQHHSTKTESQRHLESLSSLEQQDHHHHNVITTQSDAMRLFTKIPFPEPRRVIYLRERNDVEPFCPNLS